jgi:secreted trypsin-like serine protease
MQHESIAKMLKVPIVQDNQNCYHKNHLLATIGSEKTFCAGKEGVGVCLGDSGHGLFIEIENVFYLKGVVSSSLSDPSGCYTKNFAIYTNVMKYLEWIKNPNGVKETCGIMSSSAGLVAGGKVATREQFPWVVAISLFTEADGWEH